MQSSDSGEISKNTMRRPNFRDHRYLPDDKVHCQFCDTGISCHEADEEPGKRLSEPHAGPAPIT